MSGPVGVEGLLRPREMAARLQVSIGYLRNSSCPKVRLPGAGAGAKPVIRYDVADVMAWVDAHVVRPRQRKAG